MVQFYYFDNDYWAWYWAVDDVVISEIPDNAMNISEVVHGGWWVNYVNTGGDGYDYSLKPLSQLTNNPYSFESVLRNAGIASQNSYLTAEVTDANGITVYSDVSNTLLLDVNYPQDTFATNSTFSPTSTGAYTVEMWGTGDSTSTSKASLDMTVTDYVYARDYDNPDGAWRVGRSCGGQILGLKYDMYADETLYSIQVHIDSESVPGTSVYATLFEDDPAADPIYLTQTDDYVLTSADLGNWVTIPFDGGESLYAGTGYVAAVGGYANPIDTFLVSTSGESQGSCFIQDNGCDIGSGGYGYWYTTSETPMIRMNFDPGLVSISEKESLQEVSIYPNPVCNEVEIELEGLENGLYTLDFLDFLGKKVFSKDVFYDNQSVQIDISFLSNGLYMLNINNDKLNISKQFMKQ